LPDRTELRAEYGLPAGEHSEKILTRRYWRFALSECPFSWSVDRFIHSWSVQMQAAGWFPGTAVRSQF